MHVLVREGQKAIGEGRVKSQRQRCRLPFPGVLVSKMGDEDPSLNFKPGIMRGRKEGGEEKADGAVRLEPSQIQGSATGD